MTNKVINIADHQPPNMPELIRLSGVATTSMVEWVEKVEAIRAQLPRDMNREAQRLTHKVAMTMAIIENTTQIIRESPENVTDHNLYVMATSIETTSTKMAAFNRRIVKLTEQRRRSKRVGTAIWIGIGLLVLTQLAGLY